MEIKGRGEMKEKSGLGMGWEDLEVLLGHLSRIFVEERKEGLSLCLMRKISKSCG